MPEEPVVPPSENGAKPPPVDQSAIVSPPLAGAAPTVEPKPADPPTRLSAEVDQPGIREVEPRAQREDYFLWCVIALVLGYLAWYLSSTTTGFSKIDDIERLALYGMNVRAGLILLIGGALALLGCMIVLRRVRMSFTARAQFETARARVVADSAGVVVVLLGVFLLAVVVTHPPTVQYGGHATQGATPSTGLNERLKQTKDLQDKDPAGEPATSIDGGAE